MFTPNAARIKSARLTLGIAGIPDPKLQVQDMFPPDKWWRWRRRRWWRSSWPTSLSLTTSPTTSSLLRVISYLHLFSCTHKATNYHVSMWPRTHYPCPQTSFSFLLFWFFVHSDAKDLLFNKNSLCLTISQTTFCSRCFLTGGYHPFYGTSTACGHDNRT